MANEWLVVTFDTEHEALQFSSLCKNEQIEGRLMPIPRKLSAGCGISWRSDLACESAIQELVQKHTADLSCEVLRVTL
ncbi:DUF3343 domain-containing protein [Enterococcus sp. 669A]|uniref:DUF3343 domain-containing protein n=1 Tax=Candidatus Enterococcus moelleringii TaxID=2815325 RepID=A0ABS3L5T6_9ENTE|nr:DUF3343 domain-containing protein [Enterococcus sp. 669A]